jgi:ribonuclease P protein component
MMSGERANSLHRGEIARGKSEIARLFEKGSRQKGNHLLMIFSHAGTGVLHEDHRVKVLFAVSKRNVPKAVVRNRIRRLMREAYRLEKQGLVRKSSRQVDEGSAVLLIAFLYRGTADALPALHDLRSEVRQLVNRLTTRQGQAPECGI